MESTPSTLRTRNSRTSKRSTQTPARILARYAVEAARAKKAIHITVMDMRSISGFADYFVLCTGESDLQIKAIADAVRDQIREACNERPWHMEGYEHKQWVLLDYVDTVVHVFDKERRAFYNLERLWADAPMEEVGETGEVALLQEKDDDARPGSA